MTIKKSWIEKLNNGKQYQVKIIDKKFADIFRMLSNQML